jgi:sensor histidine kinase YesM
MLHAAQSFGGPEIMYFNNLPYTLTESILTMIPHALLAYAMLYVVLPKFFLKKKYLAGFVLLAVMWFCIACLNLFMMQRVNQQVLQFLMPERFLRITPRSENTTFYMGILAVMKGGMLGLTTATGVKLLKYFYLKDHHNLQLQKENAQSQLQLLTAQVHPHFLFNTLNNIFSQTQTESPKGSKMIMGLSDMLRYILYEGQKALVPLQKELQMITEYISLEKIRYGNKLEVHMALPPATEDIYIAPLLLLPFVENCFKHGASHVLEHPWINLTIAVKETTLVMKLMNGKAPVGKEPHKPGIGIANVKQRLNLLYKDKHTLQVTEDEEVFIVDLQVALTRLPKEGQVMVASPLLSEIDYA